MIRLFFKLILIVVAIQVNAQIQTGKASFYADRFDGTPTASGEKYRHNKLTGAHKTLPFGTKVKVTNLENQKSVEITINDRGPYLEGRIIDVSKSAAEQLGFLNKGLCDVQIEVIDPGNGKASNVIIPVDHVSVDEKEFYAFEPSRQDPKGFGVQIGTYQELINLMRLAENLKNSYKKEITVQVKVVNGVKYYGLIVGNFSSRVKADEFKEEVKPKFPDAFIVDYKRI